MKNKKNKNRFSGLFLLIILGLFFSQSVGAFGGLTAIKIPAWPNPKTVFDEMLNEAGLDKSELKEVTQTMNVSNYKKNPPKVSIYFNPADPVHGEKITATAAPIYFMNEIKDLYFTWFLKTADCKDEKDSGYSYERDCDLNNDGTVDIEDHKIRAMRIIASDGFELGKPYNSVAETDNDGYEAVWGGDDQRGKKNPECYVQDVVSGMQFKIDCNRHLFPNAPSQRTGDGRFRIGEEEFWKTDPQSDDTARTGGVDESNVAGLGINTFTWRYSNGDRIGVVVEGVFFEPTAEKDSNYKVMFAANEGLCEVKEESMNRGGAPNPKNETIAISTDHDPITGITTTVTETTIITEESRSKSYITMKTIKYRTTIITETITGTVISTTYNDMNNEEEEIAGPNKAIPTYELYSITRKINIEKVSHFNECLYDSLVSPAENEFHSNKLEVDLSYSPTHPINDSSPNDEGDWLVVESSVLNSPDTKYMNYDWKVFKGESYQTSNWTQILRNDLPQVGQTIGLGLDILKFKLNFSDSEDVKFLKVSLTVKENPGSVGENLNDLVREGRADIIIPISKNEDQIKIFRANVEKNASDDPFIRLGGDENEICISNIERASCPVSKNEIIGLTISNPDNFDDFLWEIDGKPFVYRSCFFENCDMEKQSGKAFFPILKEKGESYEISLTATEIATGKKLNLSRIFKVEEPSILIGTANSSNCSPVFLGKYVDVDGNEHDDYSENNFKAFTKSTIQLNTSTTGFAVEPEEIIWTVDSRMVNSSNASEYGFLYENGVLSIPSKEAKESYNISVSAIYTQDLITKKALYDFWDVPYNQFYEKKVSSSVSIVMEELEIPAGASIQNKKIFASLYLSLPSYFNFLLRIVLTIALLLFVSKLIFSFSTNEK
jgi:hypothetical protein